MGSSTPVSCPVPRRHPDSVHCFSALQGLPGNPCPSGAKAHLTLGLKTITESFLLEFNKMNFWGLQGKAAGTSHVHMNTLTG